MKSDKSDKFQRSRLVVVVWGVIMAGLLIYFLYPVVSFMMPTKDRCQNLDIVKIKAAEIPEGKSKVISYQGMPIMIIHIHGDFFALSAVTQHGCPVQWDESNQEIICACRGSKFDLYGNIKSGPAMSPLIRLKIRIVDSEVIAIIPNFEKAIE